MEKRLTADLNVVANSNLEIELLDGDLNIIQKLDDEPNDVGGLTSAELKAKFDESGNIIKKYINETLIPAVLTDDATEESRKQAEAARVAAEQGRVTAEEGRVSAEAARAAAEQARSEAESSRVSAENAREAAETARADETAGIVARATAQANAAAGSASQAAGSEQSAKDAAGTATGAASSASQSAAAASGSASQASAAAAAAAQSAANGETANKNAQSWAVGGTGTRPGEDTNNAKYWAEHAEAVAGGDFATKSEAQGYVTAHNENVEAHHDLRVAVAGSVRYDAAQTLTDEQKAQAQTNIGVDAISTKNIGSVFKSLNASELQAYLDSLPRLLTENHVITLNGTCSQDVYMKGFYGCGSLTLRANSVGDCVFTKAISIENCSVPVNMEKLKWMLGDGATSNTYCISCNNSSMGVTECSFNGYAAASNRGNGVSTLYSSSMVLINCAFHNLDIAVHTYLGGYINVIGENPESDYSGNGVGIYLYRGGLVLLGNSVPDTLGGTYNEKNGVSAIIKDGKFV